MFNVFGDYANYMPTGGGPEDGAARWTPMTPEQRASVTAQPQPLTPTSPAGVNALAGIVPADPYVPQSPVRTSYSEFNPGNYRIGDDEARLRGTGAFGDPAKPYTDTPAIVSQSLRQPVNALVPATPVAAAPAAVARPPVVAAPVVAPVASKSLSGAPLGSLTGKYESGGDFGMGHQDNIGWSYGKYQFNSRGSLGEFFKANPQFKEQFAGLNPESQAFANRWRQVSQSDPSFNDAQHKTFLTRAQPLIDKATKLGFKSDNRGVQEAILSASIQHGRADRVLQAAASVQGFKDMTPQQQLKAMYAARSQYVANLSTIDNNTRQAVLGRYPRELQDALKYAGS